jgi:cytochrome b pre-mRNA-processing protein 3
VDEKTLVDFGIGGNLFSQSRRNQLRIDQPSFSVNGTMMILKRLFQRSPTPERRCYEAIVAAARHPVFYADWGVADTLDGRFDMIALHAYLILDRLKGEEPRFRQDLVDEFFRDMDRSLREMGVGDISVGKKVRKMAEVFYGRIAAYDKAMVEPDALLAPALARNVFPDGEAGTGAERLAAYMLAQRSHLASQEPRAIAAGTVRFREP